MSASLPTFRHGLPGLVMAVGAMLMLGVNRQRSMPLRAPLSTIPVEIAGERGKDRVLSAEERRVVGMSQYVAREYGSAFSVYVGYYDQQTDGRTIHSPRNCLPGAGWEPLDVAPAVVRMPGQPVTVQRYLLAKGPHRALVYYWYQGRGRVAANEYAVKWDLLRDAALRGRTEEALVRIVVPLRGERQREGAADALASQVTATLVPALARILPAGP
ncbi:MAG: exosortase C-terminal domain/associated protein EpsI [Gemmatimonadales bacterium]